MSDPRLNILLLCDRPDRISSNVHQHLDALVGFAEHDVYQLPVLGGFPATLDLSRFDAIIIHYTLVLCMDVYVSAETRERLRDFNGIKAVFIQDEYRFINKTINALREIKANILFTCVPTVEIEKVYSSEALPGLKKINVLTGYVDDSLFAFNPPPLKDRPIDVGYRARNVPYWLGEMGREKWRIGQIFRRDANGSGLKIDISYREESRLYGEKWTDFIMRCKAMLGVESGASVFDFSGEVEVAVNKEISNNHKVSYETVREKYFKDIEGIIALNQISPRCFESAALKTLMVMYEGEYSGILQPWRHFVPLKKDHSNMDEVIAVLRDVPRCQRIVDQAYDEIAKNPKYHFRAHVKVVMHEIVAAWRALNRPLAQGYDAPNFAQAARVDLKTLLNQKRRELFVDIYHFLFVRVLGFLPESQRDSAQAIMRKLTDKLRRFANRLRRLNRSG